jgi:FkbM family methyltransferase
MESAVITPESTVIRKLKAHAANSLRNALTKKWDPLVQYELDGSLLLLPLSHNLPNYRKMHRDYSSNLGRIAREIEKFHPDATAIDVGANIGDSAAIIRHQCKMPILCIEGDIDFLKILQANIPKLGPDIYVHGGFVAAESGPINAAVLTSGGTARLENRAPTDSKVSAQSLRDILQGFPLFQRPRLLKIDTDGYDVAILMGALSMLRETTPVLFFEYDPHFLSMNGESGLLALDCLKEIGYTKALVYDNLGDFMLAGDLSNTSLWQDLDAYFSGRRGSRYMDLCLLCDIDLPLFETIRAAEIAYFASRRA